MRKLDIMAWELEQSRFHPACNPHTRQTIESTLETFSERRSSFIDDDTSLKESQSAFSKVKELLEARLHRYNFIQEVVQESRDSPAIGSKVAESTSNQKWVFGVIPRTIPRTRRDQVKKELTEVTLSNGISAYEVVLEASPWFSSTELRFVSTRAQLSFAPYLSQPPPPTNGDLSQITVWTTQAYIVGWTLSCQTEIQKEKTFTVREGGLTHSCLRIEVRPVGGILWASTWRCRIYFVRLEEFLDMLYGGQ